jgi:hypothetical protein
MGVFAAILATVFVMLGQWQLRRLDGARTMPRSRGPSRPARGPYGDGPSRRRRFGQRDGHTGDSVQVRYRSLDGARQQAVAVLQTTEGDLRWSTEVPGQVARSHGALRASLVP